MVSLDLEPEPHGEVMIYCTVFLLSLIVGRDPSSLQDACDMLGLDTTLPEVREAIMARAKL